jgi:hypothetical protein
MVLGAREPIDAAVVIAATRPWMIRRAPRVRQRAEIIVERMICLGNNYDMLQVLKIAIGSNVIRGEYRQYHAGNSYCYMPAELFHS